MGGRSSLGNRGSTENVLRYQTSIILIRYHLDHFFDKPNYYIPIETIKHGTNLHTQRLQGCSFTPYIIPPSSCLNSFGFNWRLLVAFFHIVPHFFHFVWRLRYVHPIWFCHFGFLFVNVVATVVLVCKFSSCILYL